MDSASISSVRNVRPFFSFGLLNDNAVSLPPSPLHPVIPWKLEVPFPRGLRFLSSTAKTSKLPFSPGNPHRRREISLGVIARTSRTRAKEGEKRRKRGNEEERRRRRRRTSREHKSRTSFDGRGPRVSRVETTHGYRSPLHGLIGPGVESRRISGSARLRTRVHARLRDADPPRRPATTYYGPLDTHRDESSLLFGETVLDEQVGEFNGAVITSSGEARDRWIIR